MLDAIIYILGIPIGLFLAIYLGLRTRRSYLNGYEKIFYNCSPNDRERLIADYASNALLTKKMLPKMIIVILCMSITIYTAYKHKQKLYDAYCMKTENCVTGI